jgi:hypothetical protein
VDKKRLPNNDGKGTPSREEPPRPRLAGLVIIPWEKNSKRGGGGGGDPASPPKSRLGWLPGGFERTWVGWADLTSELIINRSKTWS